MSYLNPSYVDPLHDLFHSARRCCIYMREWICSSILNQLPDLIGMPVRDRTSCLKLAEEEARLSSFPMDAPIDISSSDSENEAEVGYIKKGTSFPPGPVASASFRELPSWANTSSSNPKGSGESSKKQMLPTTESSFGLSNGWQAHERRNMQMGFELGAQPPSLDRGVQEKSQYDARTGTGSYCFKGVFRNWRQGR